MMHMTGMQVRAQDTATGSGEGDAPAVVGEDEPVDALVEEVEGGGDEVGAATTLAVTADTQDPKAEALVVVETSVPPTEPDTEGNDGEETTALERNPAGDEVKETAAPTQPEVTTETPMSEAPAELTPLTTKPAVVVETTTKPSLRTEDPAVISDAVTNDAAKTQAPGYLSQGTNPLVLVALASICCVFLLLWGRKRRSSATTSSSSSGGASSKGPKVQYKQVPDEQPFSHNQDDDDDEYCDYYEEDTFANDRDNWDDWEGNSTQTQVSQLNPFAAPPSAPRPTTPRQSNTSPIPFKLSQPLPPPPQQQQQHHAPHQEITIATTGDLLPSSVESNSSSDSFEVVTEEAHAPPTSSPSLAADEEKESESVDDLFSVRIACGLYGSIATSVERIIDKFVFFLFN
jgi:hypothetical protein